MEFRLLGSLEVVNDDGGMVPLGPPRQHALLAALVLHAGSCLSVERLVDLLWGERPPATAATIVHGSVAGLRRVLEPSRERGNPARLLVTRPAGYALEVHPEQVDAVRFERLLAEGRRHLDSDPERASRVLTEALALWRGPALSGVEEDFARAAATRVEELRLDVLEARIEADLALGRHREVVAELEGLVARHPLRERLWAHRMVALYRCGRQAEALAGPGSVPPRVELPAPAVALSGPSVGRPPPSRLMMAQLGDRRRRRTAQQLLGGCEVATGAVATQVGSWPMRPTLPAELSRRLVDAAVVAATGMSVPVTVVIVDESGVLKELCRMDGAALVTVETATSKASAAVATGMPPDEFYEAIEADGAAVAWFASRPGLALIAGGIPVIAHGQVAGAIGVAGAMTAAEDRRIAETALERALPQAGRR